MTKEARILRRWSLAVLSLFLFFQVGSHAFVHLHTVDGVRVAHSHPFAPGHTHSATEIISLAQIMATVGDDIAPQQPLPAPVCCVAALLSAGRCMPAHTGRPCRESLPAPPVV